MQIPKLLADYLRWMVVLAQLREVGGKEHRYSVKQLVSDLQRWRDPREDDGIALTPACRRLRAGCRWA